MTKIWMIILPFFLVGCFNQMPPKCDSSEAKQLLREIVAPFYKSEGYTHINLSGHEEIDKFEKAQEYRCEARVNFREGKDIYSELLDYSIFWESDKKDTFIIQINEDSNPWEELSWW